MSCWKTLNSDTKKSIVFRIVTILFLSTLSTLSIYALSITPNNYDSWNYLVYFSLAELFIIFFDSLMIWVSVYNNKPFFDFKISSENHDIYNCCAFLLMVLCASIFSISSVVFPIDLSKNFSSMPEIFLSILLIYLIFDTLIILFLLVVGLSLLGYCCVHYIKKTNEKIKSRENLDTRTPFPL